MQHTPPLLNLDVEYCPVNDLKPYSRNARIHTKHQVRQIASSISFIGFANPVLVTGANTIVAGHGRVAAAKLLGMDRVPVIRLEGLSDDQIRAYVIADNLLAETAGWDKSILAIELQHLLTIDADFDVTITGFEVPEIDLILEEANRKPDTDDVFAGPDPGLAVTQSNDLWALGKHRILCSNSLAKTSMTLCWAGDAQMSCSRTRPTT